MLECLFKAVARDGTKLAMCDFVEKEQFIDCFKDDINFESQIAEVSDDLLQWVAEGVKYVWQGPWGKLVSRSVVERYPFPNGRLYEDAPATVWWFCTVGKISLCPAVMYGYRTNMQGITKGRFSEKQLDHLWSFEQLIICFRKYDFKKMLTIICNGYLWTAQDFYIKCISELNRKDLARIVARKTRRMYKRNKDVITLTQNQINYIMETLFPKKMALYWKWKAITGRIQQCLGRKHK